LRRVDIFSRVSRAPEGGGGAGGVRAGGGVVGAVGALGAGACTGGRVAVPDDVVPSRALSMTSALLTTPPRPVPVTLARLTFCWAASRSAAGDARTSSFAGSGLAPAAVAGALEPDDP